jgi:hypothetical protein
VNRPNPTNVVVPSSSTHLIRRNSNSGGTTHQETKSAAEAAQEAKEKALAEHESVRTYIYVIIIFEFACCAVAKTHGRKMRNFPYFSFFFSIFAFFTIN